MDRLSEVVGDSRDIASLGADFRSSFCPIAAASPPPAVLICAKTSTG